MQQLRETVTPAYDRLRGAVMAVRVRVGPEPTLAETAADERAAVSSGDVPLPRNLRRETGQTPAEYLSGLLGEHDGRLKQRQIIQETGWSTATVSRWLGKLETEGIVVRFRIGRENLVCLPRTVPEVARPVVRDTPTGTARSAD